MRGPHVSERKKMNQINYQKELEKIISQNTERQLIPTLLLHSCCAPCSSYVLEYLSQYFKITVFYYNPNISPREEYEKRKAEQKRLISEMPCQNPVKILDCEYTPETFFERAKGLENCPEGGERCFVCYDLRLRRTAKEAASEGFDYFATTLSISPLKNAQKLNALGFAAGEAFGVKYLPGDFKKREGFKRSIELSGQYHLYRQNYCGCVFSKPKENE